MNLNPPPNPTVFGPAVNVPRCNAPLPAPA